MGLFNKPALSCEAQCVIADSKIAKPVVELTLNRDSAVFVRGASCGRHPSFCGAVLLPEAEKPKKAVKELIKHMDRVEGYHICTICISKILVVVPYGLPHVLLDEILEAVKKLSSGTSIILYYYGHKDSGFALGLQGTFAIRFNLEDRIPVLVKATDGFFEGPEAMSSFLWHQPAE